MLLGNQGVRTLGPSDVSAALDLCARDPIANVFVAARLAEGQLQAGATVYAIEENGGLASLLWASANVVPVGATPEHLERYAQRLRRSRRRFSSVFGEAEQALPLWAHLSADLGEPMSFRPNQPLMVATARRSTGPAEGVRRARLGELDAVVPCAAAMFTEEIGYAPYVGSDAAYRRSVAQLISAGRTFVLTDGDEIIFKADVGSLAGGVAQIQGVWVHPRHRGQGLAAPCMASVVELVRADIAEVVSLYVNDFNTPAVRAYERAGFEQVGTFATVIL